MDSLDQKFEAALSKVLLSDSFQRSPALGRLLTYLVEQVLKGDASTLKEAVIGHELYGRAATYDPKLDSVVRVTANRLRARLEEYYQAAPKELVRIVLPRGSYVPLLETREEAQAPVSSQPTSSEESVPATYESAGYFHAVEPITPTTWISKQGSRKRRIALVAFLLTGLFLCTIFWSLLHHPATTVAIGSNWNVRPFARSGGSQQFGVFSHDGSHLAYTSFSARDTKGAIYVQDASSEEARRIAAGVRPAWSPDGRSLAFLRPEAKGKNTVILYSLNTGAEMALAELDSLGSWLCQIPRLSWSPDGKVLYTTADSGGRPTCGLVEIDVATHQIHTLTPPVTLIGDLDPNVSPDGATIAFLRCLAMGATDLFLVSTHGGEPRRVTYDGADISGFDWSPDGKALIVASSRETGTRKLWRVPIDGGAAEALTDGSASPTFPAVSADGSLINFTQFRVTAPIMKAADGKTSEILDDQSKNDAPAISSDGRKLLYTSDRAGRKVIWLSNADGSASRPLLTGNTYETGWARWSPDGRRILMECRIAKNTYLCLADADGREMHQLKIGNAGQELPTWSRDGTAIYFTSEASGRGETYRFNLASETSVQMTHQGGNRAIESWDGRWLFVNPGQLGGIIALPLPGTEKQWRAAEKLRLLPELNMSPGTAWDAGKEGIVYLAFGDGSKARLELFNPETKTSRPLVALGAVQGTEFALNVLPDGLSVLYTDAHTRSELSMMSAQSRKAAAGPPTLPPKPR